MIDVNLRFRQEAESWNLCPDSELINASWNQNRTTCLSDNERLQETLAELIEDTKELPNKLLRIYGAMTSM